MVLKRFTRPQIKSFLKYRTVNLMHNIIFREDCDFQGPGAEKSKKTLIVLVTYRVRSIGHTKA